MLVKANTTLMMEKSVFIVVSVSDEVTRVESGVSVQGRAYETAACRVPA